MNVFGLFTSVVAFYLLAPEPYFPFKPHIATTIASLLLQVASHINITITIVIVQGTSSSVSSYSCVINAALTTTLFRLLLLLLILIITVTIIITIIVITIVIITFLNFLTGCWQRLNLSLFLLLCSQCCSCPATVW